MIIEKNIDVKITKQNIDYFKKFDYIVNLKDIITIPIEHLQKQSHKKLHVRCDVCGLETILSYKNYNKNFKKYNLYTCLKCSCIKNKKTCLEKYGVEHQMLFDETKEKIKKTCIKKYGVDNPLKDNNIKEKIKATFNDKYGSDNSFMSNIILDKIKNTNKKKYKNDYYFGSEEFKNSIKDTFVNKYGVDNPSKSIELQTKKLKKLYCKLNIINIDFKNKKYTIFCDVCKKQYDIPFIILHQRFKIYKTTICTICNPIGSSSNSGFEVQLQEFIKENYNKEISLNDRKTINPYEIDIYLPELKLAFEFNGLYWHSEIFKENYYHFNKTELCEKNEMKLIQIYEDDWLYKTDIVKSRILNLIGKSNKIMARKCDIKEITDNKLVKIFLEKNHLQGFVGSKIKIGLFNQNELVSIMTFGSLRKSMGQKSIDDTYEILRFCNKLNTNVIGSASKLFKYFIKKYNPIEIISYADRSWSTGNLYENLGFKLIHKTRPNYFYIIDGIRKYRFNFRKDNLVKNGEDPNKSEHDIMIEKNIFRIYDSGNLKYIWNK